MKRFNDLLADAQTRVRELMPWDLRDRLAAAADAGDAAAPLLLDVREPDEFARLRIAGSLNVPRGLLEQACEWDFDATVPALAGGRGREIVVVCRSGQRSLLAADVMQTMGFTNVVSLKTGLRGWNDFEQPLLDAAGQPADIDAAESELSPPVSEAQRRPVTAAAAAAAARRAR